MARIVLLLGMLALLPARTEAQVERGTLLIESDPPGAVVLVDSVRAGRTPLQADVAPGVRRVEVLYVGYEPFVASVAVRTGATARVDAALVRRTGALSVGRLPAGATVTVDGAPVEGTVAVPTGEARVRVDVPGQPPAEAVVRVESRTETQVAYGRRAFDARTAALAVFAPGSAQILNRRAVVGVAALVGISAAVGVAFAARGRQRSAERDVDAAVEVYTVAESEAAAVAARAEVERLVGEAQAEVRRQNTALGVAAAVYGATLVDAVVRHAFRPSLRATVVRLGARLGAPGLRLSVSF